MITIGIKKKKNENSPQMFVYFVATVMKDSLCLTYCKHSKNDEDDVNERMFEFIINQRKIATSTDHNNWGQISFDVFCLRPDETMLEI